MSAPDPHPPKPVERHRWLRWALDAALIVLVIVAVQLWQTRHVPFGAAPDFAGPLATGGAMRLAAWRADHPGRPVAVYFWADWCPICKAQQGSVASLAGDWPVLTVAMQSGPPAEVARVLAERGLAWPTVVDEDGAALGTTACGATGAGAGAGGASITGAVCCCGAAPIRMRGTRTEIRP
mgnify:CR=1 FL=1